MQETWWEHHVVSFEPELDTILGVDRHLLSSFLESKSTKDHSCGKDVTEEAGVVQRSVSLTDESGTNWSHHAVYSEDTDPEEVYYSEHSMKGMLTVFSLAHLEWSKNSTNESCSLTELLIDEVLEASGVFKQKLLDSLCHFLINKLYYPTGQRVE